MSHSSLSIKTPCGTFYPQWLYSLSLQECGKLWLLLPRSSAFLLFLLYLQPCDMPLKEKEIKSSHPLLLRTVTTLSSLDVGQGKNLIHCWRPWERRRMSMVLDSLRELDLVWISDCRQPRLLPLASFLPVFSFTCLVILLSGPEGNCPWSQQPIWVSVAVTGGHM